MQCDIMSAKYPKMSTRVSLKQVRTNRKQLIVTRQSSRQDTHEHVAHKANNDPPHEQAQGHVEHLHAVPPARAGHKVTAVIDIGELLAFGHTLAEEVAQGLPSFLDAELEQTLGVLAAIGGQVDHVGVVAAVDILAGRGKGTLEEGVEEHLEHGVVHLGGPGAGEAKGEDLVAERGELVVGGAPKDGGHGGFVPAVDLTSGQDNLGLGVDLDKLLGESTSGPVAYGLAIAEQLVPELAGADGVWWQGGALGEVLGNEGIVPQKSVGGVFNGSTHHVVCLDVAQVLHSRTHSCKIKLVN